MKGISFHRFHLFHQFRKADGDGIMRKNKTC